MKKVINFFKPNVKLLRGTRLVSFLFIGISVAIAAGVIFGANIYYDIDTSKIMIEDAHQATTTQITVNTGSTALTVTQRGAGADFLATSTSSMTSDIFKIANLGSGRSFVVEDSDTDTDPFVIDSDGNVGIASSTPSAKLGVQGNVMIANGVINITTTTATSTLGQIEAAAFKLTANPFDGFVLASNASGYGTWQSISIVGYWTDSGTVIYPTNYSSRDVAVATTTSRYDLDVWGDLAVGTSTAYSIPALLVDSGNGGAIMIGTTTSYGLLTVGTSTPSIVVAPNGYVGIGTTTPSEIFAVQSNIIGMGNIVISGTLNTGQGATEVYPMNQPVRSTDAVTFNDVAVTYGISAATSTITATSTLSSINADSGLFYVDAYANRIGIATTSPRYKLDVWGDLAVGTSTGVSVPQNYPLLFVNSGDGGLLNGVGIGTTTVSGTMLTVGTTTPVLVVSQTGNVGVGTASPGSKLVINSNTGTPQSPTANTVLQVVGADSSVARILLDTYNGASSLTFRRANGTAGSPSAVLAGDQLGELSIHGYRTTGYSANGAAHIRAEAAANWTDTSEGTYWIFDTTPIGSTTEVERMRIGSTGYIGIGTTTLSGLLTVGTTTPSLVVAPTGYVGIGTANPAASLEIDGSHVSGKGILYLKGVGGLNVGHAFLSLDATTDNEAGLILKEDDVRKWQMKNITLSDDQLQFNAGTGTNIIMVLNQDNKVGISTTSPRYTLDVWGDLAVGTSTGVSVPQNYPLLYVQSGDGGLSNGVGIGTTTVSGTMLTVGTTTPALVVSQNGYVGIGTAGPSSPLHVYSGNDDIAKFEGIDHTRIWVIGTDNSEKSVEFYEGGTAKWKIGMDNAPAGTEDDFIIKQLNNLPAEFTIKTTGNIGIGNTGPTSKLTVNGGDIVVSSTGAATTTISSATSTFAGAVVGGGAQFIIATTTSNILMQPYGGNVGIASSTPSAVLAMQGNMMIANGVLTITTTTATSTLAGPLQTSQVKITGPVTPATGYVLTATDNLGNAIWQTIGGSSITADSLDWSEFKDAMTLDATTTIAMDNVSLNFKSGTLYIDGVNSRIGIGNAAPTSKLTVNGGDIVVSSTGAATTTISSATSTLAGGLIVDTSTLYLMSDLNRIGIATTTPRYTLDVWGSLAVGTTTSPVFFVDTGATGNTPGITVGADISLGSIQVASSSGAVTLVDTVVEASASAGTEESYSFQIDSNELFRIYSESNGSGGIQNKRVFTPSGVTFAMGTTTPRYTLDVWGDLAVGTSTGVSAPMNYPLLYVQSGDGGTSNGVGIGTTTVSGTMLTVGTTTPALVVSQNGYVGIGTVSPATILHMIPSGSNNTLTISANTGYELITDTASTLDIATQVSTGGPISISARGTGNGLYLNTSNNVGIGNAGPTSKLTVNGGDIAVSSAGSATTTISSATSTFAHGLIVDTNTLYVMADTGYVGIGTATPRAPLDISAVTSDTLGSNGFNIFNSADSAQAWGLRLGVSNVDLAFDREYSNTWYEAMRIQRSTGNVGIASSSPSAILAVQGNIMGSGNMILYGTPAGTDINNGLVYLNPPTAGTNNVIFGIAVGGVEKIRMDAEGDVQIVGLFNSTKTDGTNQLSGHLSVLGNTTLGDNTADTITFTGRANSSFLPASDSMYDLGSASNRWNNIYAGTTTISNLIAGGTASSTFIINTDNATADTENATLEFERGSATPNAILGWDSSADKFYFNNFPVDIQNILTITGTASSTFSGPLWLTGTPLGTGLSYGSLYINPSSGATNNTLMGVAVAGVERFKIDAEGDVTVQGSLGVENTLYDITQDTLTVNDNLQFLGTLTGANSEQLLLGVTDDLAQLVRGGNTYVICDSSANCQSVTGGYIGGSGNAGYVPKFTNTYLIGNSLIYDSGTNVGIATSSPRYKLDVWGNFAVGTSTATTSNSIVPAFFVSSGNGPQVGIGTTTLSTNLFTVGTTTPNLVVANNGYVGIASSTPSETFAVQGNMLGMGNIVISGTLNTGQGATEVYPMNQPVRSTDAVAFNDIVVTYGLSAATSTVTATSTLSSINADSGLFYVDAYANRIGIATTSPRYTLDVWGDMAIGTSTATSSTAIIPAFFVDSGDGPKVGIGTTTLSTNLLTVGTTTPSLVVANNGYIGIGTTGPNYPLTISSASDQLRVTDGTISTVLVASPGSGSGIAGTTSNHPFRLITNNVESMRISAAGGLSFGSTYVNTDPGANNVIIQGNVGIGNSGPTSKLTVNGGDFKISSTGAATTTISSNVSTFAGGLISTASSTFAGGATTTFEGGIIVDTNTLYVMADTGNVGIGTATPGTRKLYVSGDIYATSDIFGTTFQDQSDGTYRLDPANTGNSLIVAGSVGIATTSPRYKLDVWGDLAVGTSTGVGAPQNYPLLFVNSGEGGLLNGVGIGTTTVSGTMLTVGTTTPALVVSQNGYVGIGTTGPSQKLQIDTGNIRLTDNYQLQWGTGAVSIEANAATGYMRFLIGSDEKARINSSGNVGIGNTGPTSKLTVNGGDFVVSSTGAATTTISSATSTFAGAVVGGGAQFIIATTTSNVLLQPYGGDVGIGTTTPAAQLTIVETGQSNPLNLWANATSVLNVDVSGNLAITGAMYQDMYGSDDGLVLYLPFSEGMTSSSASIAYDRSPYGNDGTATGMPMPSRNATSGESGWSTTTCKVGSCMTFDGSNDYVSVPDASTLSMGNGNFTTEVWLKYNVVPSADKTFLAKFATGGTLSNYEMYFGDFGANVGARWTVGVSDWRTFDSKVAPATSTWYHFVLVHNSGTMRWYTNGAQTNSGSSGGTISTTSANLILGARQSVGAYSNVVMDEVRIYKRALSADEIRAHYLRGLNANGALLADKFRVINTTNNVTFQIDSLGNTTFSRANATATFAGNIKMADDKWLGLGENKGRLVFDDQSTDYLTILDANVGIGTTTPRYLLDVWGDMAVGTSTGVGAPMNYPLLYVQSGDGGLSNGVGIGTTTVSGTMLTVGTTTPSLVVSQNGYVGIGTASPVSALDVNGTITIRNQFNANSQDINNVNSLRGRDDAVFNINPNTLLTAATEQSLNIRTLNSASDAWVNALTVSPNGANPSIYLLPAGTGNVGIGNAVPTSKLTVNGGDFTISSAGAATTTISSATSTFAGAVVGGGAQFIIATSTSNILLQPYGGNVGIGTTTPAAKLTIVETSTQNPLNLWANATSVMSVDVSGNVNITGAMYQDIYGSDDGLVLYLPFSEGMTSSSANIAYDRSPYGNDGTATNMPMPARNATSGESGWATTTSKCKVPGCMSFDGVNDSVDVGNANVLNSPANITMEAWFKVNAFPDAADYDSLISKMNSAATSWKYSIHINPSGVLYTTFEDLSTVTTNHWTATVGVWSHIVITYDGVRLKSYKDGELIDDNVRTGTPGTSNRDATIGNALPGGFRSFNGLIDEVRIYNRALTADEIRAHYLRGNQAYGALVADKFRVIGTDNNVDFIVNSGDVGIGTTTPSTKLAVQGNIMGSGNLVIYDTTATSTFKGGLSVGNNAALVVNQAASANSLYIAANGNVGIGTTGPLSWSDNTALTIEKSGTGTNYGADIQLKAEDWSRLLFADAADDDVGRIIYDHTSTANSMSFWTNDTQQMTILSSGNVGIGTTGPSELLTVFSATDPTFQIGTGSATTTISGLTTATSTIISGLSVGNNAALVVNQAASANSLYIATNGNVGIGTASPDSKLQVANTIEVGDVGLSNGSVISAGSLILTADWNNDSTESAIIFDHNSQTVNGGTELMRIQENGNVGIGNAGPTSKLTVNGGDIKVSSTGSATTTISSNVSKFAGGLISQASSTFTGIFNIGSAGINATSTDDISLAYTNRFRIATSTDADILKIDSNGGVYLANSMYQDIYGSDDGLVLYLPFSEGMTSSTASIAYDRSPYGNDGTATGMPMPTRNATSGESGWATTTAKCKVPGCMSFDGVNDYVDAGSGLSITNAFTLESWIKISALNTRYVFLSQGDRTPFTFETNLGVTNRLSLETTIDSTYYNFINALGPAFEANRWYHIAFTHALASGAWAFYVDGVKYSTGTQTGSSYTVSGNLFLGKHGADLAYLNGSLDEVRIYNRALSADEIRAHYLRGTGEGGAVLADKFRIIGTDNNIDFIVNAGDVGIGTTTPSTKLSVAGNIIGSGNIVVYGSATSTFVGPIAQPSGNLTIGSAVGSLLFNPYGGNVGVATTTPSMAFSVGGQCVTGDTRLRRRRKRKLTPGVDGETPGVDAYVYDEVRIDQIQPGDEIASLDEKTGKIVYRKVNALLDMGVKEIFKLVTESGRTIRTTINHPYLVRHSVSNKPSWQKVSRLKTGDEIAVPVDIGSQPNQKVLHGAELFDTVGSGVEPRTFKSTEQVSAVAPTVGEYLPPAYRNEIMTEFQKNNNPLIEQKVAISDTLEYVISADTYFNYSKPNTLVKSDILWDKIVSIEHVGEEQVYDIEVEGTHNFIGNDIFAHNTYMSATTTIKDGLVVGGNKLFVSEGGNVGIGTTGPDFKLEVTASTSLGYFAVGNVDASGDKFIVDENGSVGIGTTGPGQKLEVVGNILINTPTPRTRFRDSSLGTDLKQWDIVHEGGEFRFQGVNDAGSAGDVGIAMLRSASSYTIDALRFLTQGAERVRITSGGNVGIGNTGPTSKLTVSGGDLVVSSTGAATSTISGATTATSTIISGLSAGNNAALVVNQAATANSLYIAANGNVGIGTTAPGEKLHVYSTGGTRIKVDAPANQAPGFEFGSAGTSQMLLYRPANTNDLRIYNGNAGADLLTIKDTSGNVGIGTTAPGYKLTVSGGGTAITGGDLTVSSAGSATTTISSATSTFAGPIVGGGSQFIIATTTGNVLLQPYGGNVGIGTTTPSAKLTIIETGSQNPLSLWANATSVMSVDVSGNVALTGAMYQDIYGSDDGLVLYLPFSEGMTSSSANIAYDRSPYGNDGTATGMPMPSRNATSGESGWATTTAKCKVPGCMSFDGANDYVSVSDTSVLDITTAITISAWVNLTDVTDNRQIVSKNGTGSGFNSPYHFNVDTTTGKTRGRIGDGVSVSQDITGDTNVANGSWHYVVFSYDANNLYLYVDGKSDATPIAKTITPLTNNTALMIGSWNDTWNKFLGSLDEVRIYNRALTADEIRAHYLRGTGAGGAVVADKFRVIGTDNNVDFIVNAGRFGIGTTTLSGLLTVGTTTPVLVVTAAGDVEINKLSYAATAGTVADAGTLRFANNNQTALSFRNAANSGNINFGVNSSDHFAFGQAIQMSGYAVQGDTSASGKLYLKSTTGVGTSDAIIFQVGSNGATEAMRIITSGNVGIGTTTPSGLLTVATTTGPALLYVDRSSGNVGIGTTAPQNLLTIAKSGSLSTTPGIDFFGTTNGDAATLYNTGRIYSTFGAGNNYVNDTRIIFATASGGGTFTDTMTIRSGNVGIGTAGPSELLTVFSATDPTFQIGTGSATTTISGLTTATSTIISGLSVGNNAALVVNQAATANSLYIAANGNVGIGTTAPGLKLEVNGDTGIAIGSGYYFRSTDANWKIGSDMLADSGGMLTSNTAQLLVGGDAGQGFQIMGHTAPTVPVFEVAGANGNTYIKGNVGIATTSPRYKLDVWGDMAIGTSTGTNVPILYVDSGNNYGSVGIGTTTPTGLLTVGTSTPAFFITNAGLVGFNNVTYSWPASQGSASTFLKNDGSGNLSWSAAGGDIMLYGDGSDGDVTISSDTTTTRDMFYNDLTINASTILNPDGYRIFVKGTLTNSGTIRSKGGNGGNGGNGQNAPGGQAPAGTGGTAGATGTAAIVSAGYLPASLPGRPGATGGNGGEGAVAGDPYFGQGGGGPAGIAGQNQSYGLGSNGTSSVAGGTGGNGAAAQSPGGGGGTGPGAAGGTVTMLTAAGGVRVGPSLVLWRVNEAGTSTIAFKGSAGNAGPGGGGGGGGAGGNNDPESAGAAGAGGGGSGGTGANGGYIAIYAKTLVLNGDIQANGGTGGNGGNGGNGIWGSGGGGGGSGGNGGNGGLIVVIYNSKSGSGSITVSAGSGGTKGTKGTGGTGITDGNNGGAGLSGTLIEIQN